METAFGKMRRESIDGTSIASLSTIPSGGVNQEDDRWDMEHETITGLTETQSNSFPVVVLVSSSSNSRLNLCLNQRRTFSAFRSSLNRNWNRRFRARQLSRLGMLLLCKASTKLCNIHNHFYISFNPEV